MFTRRELFAGVIAGAFSQLPLEQFAQAWSAWSMAWTDSLWPEALWLAPAVGIWGVAGAASTVLSGNTEPDTAALRGARSGALAGAVGGFGSLSFAAAIAGGAPALLTLGDHPLEGVDLGMTFLGDHARLNMMLLAVPMLAILAGAVAGAVAALAVTGLGLTRGGREGEGADPWGLAVALVALTPFAIPMGGELVRMAVGFARFMVLVPPLLPGLMPWLLGACMMVQPIVMVLVTGAVVVIAARVVRTFVLLRDDVAVRIASLATVAATTLVALGVGAYMAMLKIGTYDLMSRDDALAWVGLYAVAVALASAATLGVLARPSGPPVWTLPPTPWASLEGAVWFGVVLQAVFVTGGYRQIVAKQAIGASASMSTKGVAVPPGSLEVLTDVLAAVNDRWHWLQLPVPLLAFGWIGPAIWLVARWRRRSPDAEA